MVSPVAEEVKAKPVMLRSSQDDYYGSLSDTCEDRNVHMDSLKVNTGCFFTTLSFPRITNCLFFFVCLNQQPRSEESVQARYPQSSTKVLQPGRAAVNRIEQVHIATSGEETPT